MKIVGTFAGDEIVGTIIVGKQSLEIGGGKTDETREVKIKNYPEE